MTVPGEPAPKTDAQVRQTSKAGNTSQHIDINKPVDPA